MKQRVKKIKYDPLNNEIKFIGVVERKNSVDLSKCLNWYNAMDNQDVCDTWLKEYMANNNYTKSDMTRVVNSPSSLGPLKKSCAYLARMVSNGTVFAGEMEGIVDKRIQLCLQMHYTDVEKTEPSNVISIQEKIKQASVKYCIEIEDEIDKWFFSKSQPISFSMYAYLQKNQISKPLCNHIKEFIKPKLQEIQLAVSSKDEQLVEGYSFLPKKRIKDIIYNFELMIKDIERHCENNKAQKPRKQRKKTPVSIDKQINKLKYQKEFSQLKITSINPLLIVGADQLWTFNTKYNYLTVYVSDSSNGLAVKGTTIINYSPDTSQRKRIRKPKELVEKVLGGNKTTLRSLMNDLKTKKTSLNGRINEDTVLLKILK